MADVAYVWGGGDRLDRTPGLPGQMHARLIPQLIEGVDVLDWADRATWRGEYELIIVHYFPRNYPVVEVIREKFPAARIAIRPDRPPEHVAATWGPRHVQMLKEFKAADVIVSPVEFGGQAGFWAQLTDKATGNLPTPIRPHPEIDVLRKRPREDVIAGWDHGAAPRVILPTLMALAGLQRETGYRVVIAQAHENTKALCDDLELTAAFVQVDHAGTLDLLSRAKLVVDLYMMSTPGRLISLAAYVGTPSVGSLDNPDVGHDQAAPWTGQPLARALCLLEQPDRTEAIMRGIETVEANNSPAAVKTAIERLKDGS